MQVPLSNLSLISFIPHPARWNISWIFLKYFCCYIEFLLLLTYPSLLLFHFSCSFFWVLYDFCFVLFLFFGGEHAMEFWGGGSFCNCWQLNVSQLLLLWLYLKVVVIFWIVNSTNLYSSHPGNTTVNVMAMLQWCCQGFDMLSPRHRGFTAPCLYQTVRRTTVEEGWCNACWEFLTDSLKDSVQGWAASQSL